MSKMSKKKFKVEDLVKLKSGGPEMIVVEEDSSGANGITPCEAYCCMWFTEKKIPMKDSFPAVALEKVVKSSKKL